MNIKDSQLNMRTKINRKSDFDFIVLDSEGNAIDMPSNDFTLDIWTWRSAFRFRASSIGGVLKGCKNDGGKLRVYVDNPGFAPGKLVGEWVSYISNEEYQDGTQRTYYLISDFGIDMVDESTQINDVQVVAMMQYIKGASAYEIACEYGFEGTEQEWLDSLALPSVQAAEECRQLMTEFTIVEDEREIAEADRRASEAVRISNEQTRQSNEQNRTNAESGRASAENQRQADEQARVAAETLRESAETDRTEAEAARAEEFAGFTTTLAAKEDVANKTKIIDAASTDKEYPSAKAVLGFVENEMSFKEDKGNKTQVINAASTETEYPSAKAVWDALEDKFWYGIEKDTTVSTPTCIRIGNMELHRTLPIHSLMRGCLLADDGTVNKYLDPDDWTNEVLDGSQGQVMVEIPRHYRKFETEGNIIRVKLSLLSLEGFHEVPKMYVSAYEATVQRSTNKLASVCSTDVDYRGGNNNASYDGTYRSFLGLPATSISLNDFRTKARNRGSVEWNCYIYQAHKALWWLFAVEYANFNSQADFNAALDENGYHQGGLGAGVTTWDITWNTFNGYNPIVPCGVTNSLGNHTGTVDYNVIGADGATLKTFAVPRYRGIENPFGHIWKWTDGCKCIIQSEASGALSKFYVCDDPAKFTASGVGNYDYRGDLPRKEGYVKALILGEDGEIMPLEVGGGSTTYFCDYFYTNIPSSGEAERGVLFGGYASDGVNAGFVFARTYNAPTYASTYIGSRLCFIPQKI